MLFVINVQKNDFNPKNRAYNLMLFDKLHCLESLPVHASGVQGVWSGCKQANC